LSRARCAPAARTLAGLDDRLADARAEGVPVVLLDRDLPQLDCDDLDWTVMVEPQISVVAQSPMLMGRMAGKRLFARIKGDDQPKRRIVLPTQLIIRASTGTRPEQDEPDKP
jgi:ABC-type sugar transport system substrate-binding protein